MTLLPPTIEQWEKMHRDLHQTPEHTKRDLQLLREWLKKQPHLPQHMEEARLERFLYGCKYSLEQTKKKLDTYYTVRANIPIFFSNRDPKLEEFQACFDHLLYFPLPGLTAEGYRVTLFKLTSYALADFNVPVIVKRIVMTLDVRLLEEKCLNNLMVFDLLGLTMGHYVHCVSIAGIFQKALLSIQDAFPMRLAQVHFLNVPPFIEKVLALFKPLLKKKLIEKFQLHTAGGECLQELMLKEILPEEFGGQAGKLADINDAWNVKLTSLREWFIEEDKVSKADESKRPFDQYKSTHNEQLTGLHGSFRKLALD